MADCVTDGVDAACSRARILAFVVNTSFVGWTVGVEDTLWSTSQIRIPEVTRKAGTSSSSLLCSALCIGSTRSWVAWINNFRDRFSCSCYDFSALIEWITCEASWTLTDRLMVHYLAASICTAGSGARVSAFLIDACFIAGTFGVNYAFRSTVGWDSNIAG